MRYAEIDIARSIAILMMIVYHIAYDLWAFYEFRINPLEGGWKILQIATATLFLFIVGLSFMISFDQTWRGVRFRSLRIFSAALLVTIVTYLFDPETFVRFGILHLIGLSILLLPFFVRLKEWNVLIGIAIVLLGINVTALYPYSDSTIDRNTFLNVLLTIVGLPSPTFTTMDYYPLLPWFGSILIGMGIGHFIYIRNKVFREKYQILDSRLQILTWPGKNALLIYLIHQPFILAILTTIKWLMNKH